MSFLVGVTFMEICLSLVTLAVAERCVVPYLPDTLVGPKGLLLKTKG